MSQRCVDPELFSCSVCLDRLKDPVTIPCGHSYCSECVTKHWDNEQHKQLYSCPQCRHSFSSRPVLGKNVMLADLVEQLKKTGLTAPPADQCDAGAQDVSCDVCTERKLKAVKSCLQCLASFCQSHLQTHYDAPVFHSHQLVAPSNKLQENICSKHNKFREIFCRSDQQLICYLCSMDDHQGHRTVSAATERAKRQKKLPGRKTQLLRSLQLKQTELDRLLLEGQDISRSAHIALQSTEDSFTEMVLLLEKRRSEVEQQIHNEEQTQLRRVRELQDQVERDMTELQKDICELDTLSLTEDHAQFLQLYTSLTTHSQKKKVKIQTERRQYFTDVVKAVSALRDRLKLALEEDPKTPQASQSPAEPSSRDDFLQCFTELTWDPNTTFILMSLSDENRKVTYIYAPPEGYYDHPERFSHKVQVLSKESLTGRCYFEVEPSVVNGFIAVSYKSIRRKGDFDECMFGYNDKSWSLELGFTKYSFRFNNIQSEVSGPPSFRIGVYLDHSAGTLLFYSIDQDHTMTLLHRVQTSFTQPLYAGISINWPYTGDYAILPKLK